MKCQFKTKNKENLIEMYCKEKNKQGFPGRQQKCKWQYWKSCIESCRREAIFVFRSPFPCTEWLSKEMHFHANLGN